MIKIVILQDQILSEQAPEDEHDTINQARAVFQALADLGYEPIDLFFSLDLNETIHTLRTINPALVFNLVESVNGKGQMIYTAPTILDYLQLPYTGSRTEALFLTSNKLLAKKMLRISGICTPSWVSSENLYRNECFHDAPFIIKSVWEHASKGLNDNSLIFAKSYQHLYHEMKLRRKDLDDDCFAEDYIDGREFTISLLAGDCVPEVLPSAEIQFIDYPPDKAKIITYKAKWQKGSFEYDHTSRCFDCANRDIPLRQQLAKIARGCWNIFGLRGFARVDFRIDQAGKPWVLDVNANPCLAPDSGFIAAANQAGLSFNQVIKRILKASSPFHGIH